jgi:predicted transposase/invertase (TIGR01784 family)
MTRQLISFDWAMKKLLRSKANFGILEGFLSELLSTDITVVEILESETNMEYGQSKQSRVDIKVRDASAQLILIEIQYAREFDFLLRLLFETSKCVTEHLKKGSAYSGVVKVISISILYFDYCQGDDYVYHGTTDFIGLHKGSQLTLNARQKKSFDVEQVSDLFPEYYIINISNFENVATDTLDEWIYFLKNEEIKPHFKAKGLLEAKEALDVMKLTPAEKVSYDHYQMWLHRQASLFESNDTIPREEGREKGKEEGEIIGEARGIEKERLAQQCKQHQEKIDSAKEMLKLGLALKDMARITGLDDKEITNLP